MKQIKRKEFLSFLTRYDGGTRITYNSTACDCLRFSIVRNKKPLLYLGNLAFNHNRNLDHHAVYFIKHKERKYMVFTNVDLDLIEIPNHMAKLESYREDAWIAMLVDSYTDLHAYKFRESTDLENIKFKEI
jgi:hypothetical protein